MGKRLRAELLGLEVWDQGMMLGLREPKTGARSWESQFVMPVISAFLPSGAEISLSQAAAPPLALPEAPTGAGPARGLVDTPASVRHPCRSGLKGSSLCMHGRHGRHAQGQSTPG